MTKQILSEEFRRMQKLAGIITESAFNKDGEPIMTYNQSTEERNNEMNIDAQDRKNNRAEMGGYGLGENLDAKYQPGNIYKYAVRTQYIIGSQGREDILYFKSEKEAKEYFNEKPKSREYLGVKKTT